jgi:hypothetical protein
MSQETSNNKIVKFETRVCDLCKEIGQVEAVEMLPGNGILFECKHDSGKECEWAVYSEGLGSLRNIKNDRNISAEIECPQCHNLGVIKTERADNTRPDRYRYRISHPNGGRCRISKESRHIVLKALGRYIEPTGLVATPTIAPLREDKQQQQQQQERPRRQEIVRKERRPYKKRERIQCPICNEMGNAFMHDNSLVVMHYRGQKGNRKATQEGHFMTTLEQKKKFMNATTTRTLNSFQKLKLEKQIDQSEKAHLIEVMKSVQKDALSIQKQNNKLLKDVAACLEKISNEQPNSSG